MPKSPNQKLKLLYLMEILLQQTDEGFLKFYGELLDKLRVRFPDTPIYVQSITPTTQEYGEKKPQLEGRNMTMVLAPKNN